MDGDNIRDLDYSPGDVGLIERISDGDVNAFEILYDTYSGLLYRVVVKILRTREEAEDILQEVFVQIWKKAASYNPSIASPSAWIIRIARNKAIDCLRSKRRQMNRTAVHLDGEPHLELTEPIGNPETSLDTDEEGKIIREALLRLPEEQKAVIILMFYEGYSHSEIAESLALPLGTVKSRIRLGMHAMHKIFTESILTEPTRPGS